MEADRTTNVLVVDDEAALLESYAAMLSARYEVATATSGTAALETLDEETDVVLLDRRMPEQSGAEILSEIRSRQECQVVFCSAVVPGTEIIPLDLDDYLQKPVGPDELVDVIETQAELATESEGVREYAALEAKRTALETAEMGTTLEDDEQYQQLLDRIERKEKRLDTATIDVSPA